MARRRITSGPTGGNETRKGTLPTNGPAAPQPQAQAKAASAVPQAGAAPAASPRRASPVPAVAAPPPPKPKAKRAAGQSGTHAARGGAGTAATVTPPVDVTPPSPVTSESVTTGTAPPPARPAPEFAAPPRQSGPMHALDVASAMPGPSPAEMSLAFAQPPEPARGSGEIIIAARLSSPKSEAAAPLTEIKERDDDALIHVEPAEPAQAKQSESPPQPFAAAPSPDPGAPAGAEPAPEEPAAQPPLLFEIAWEVCWQLGGIYTVLKTKAPAMLDRWGDRYCLIGPYNPHTAAVEFEEQPTYGSIRDTINRLREWGLTCHFGRWLVPGRPRVILIDYRGRFGSLDHDKYLMWKDHGIDLPASDGEMNEVIAFGFAVTEFFTALTQIVRDRPVLAHFHEWMGGVAVPRIAHLRLPVSTVFTTHATLLGRYLAGDNPSFYEQLPYLNPDAEAAKYQIYPRHAIERAAAHASVVFTTVSEVTGVEAEKLLGRRADVIVPNGINIHRFHAPHEFQHLHATYKEKIHEFVTGHFFPSYTFDLDNTAYLFTSGRYEYRNKGMDMYIEALQRLNWRLKQVEKPPTVVAFIITRAAVRNINVDVLRNQSMFEDLRKTSEELQEQMGSRLLRSAVTGRLPTYGELLPDDAQVRLKRAMHAWRTWKQPLIVTHDLADDANDPVLKHLRYRGLYNAADDPVKVVFHPEFVTATSPTISLDYEQFVRGCHMGVFTSYYEPWGYTPMECIACGVPTVTTDLSGFGAYVQRNVPELQGRRGGDAGRRGSDFPACCVLNRRHQGFDQTTDALVDYLMAFLRLTRRERIELRNNVERLGERFDWSNLARHYDEAHGLALERVGAKRQGALEVRLV